MRTPLLQLLHKSSTENKTPVQAYNYGATATISALTASVQIQSKVHLTFLQEYNQLQIIITATWVRNMHTAMSPPAAKV